MCWFSSIQIFGAPPLRVSKIFGAPPQYLHPPPPPFVILNELSLMRKSRSRSRPGLRI